MMANIKCWLGSFVIFQGFRISIARKPYIFVIFQGGGGSGPPAPSGSTHEGALLVFEPDPDGSRLSCILWHLVAFWRKDCIQVLALLKTSYYALRLISYK